MSSRPFALSDPATRRRTVPFLVFAGLLGLMYLAYRLFATNHTAARTTFARPPKVGAKPPVVAAENPWHGLGPVVPDTDWSRDREFVVVIDAGSSGSRAQVYSWKSPEHVRAAVRDPHVLRGLPIVEKGDQAGELWQYKESPGISNYAGRVHRLKDHLQPLLDAALQVVPSAKVAVTPVYLFATAGMRLLPPKQQHALLDQSCQYVKHQTRFYVGTCAQHFQVITGAAEGIYGWMAVNYLLSGFAKTGDRRLYDAPVADPAEHGSHKHTFGFLDMGGASTQIAFEPTPQMAIEHADDLTVLTMRNLDGQGAVYKVFTTTFLGFGSNEARRRHVQALFAPSEPGGTVGPTTAPPVLSDDPVPDPCLPPGLILEVKAADLVGLARVPTGRTVTLEGTGSFTECARRAVSLLNKHAPCPTDPCLFNGVHSPLLDFTLQQFVGISEYWYSAEEVFHLGGTWDYTTFERQAVEYCGRPWAETRRLLGSSHRLDRLQDQCFKAAWLTAVLHDGLGIPRDATEAVHPEVTSAIESAVNMTDRLQHLQDAGVAAGISVPFQSVHTVEGFEVSWTLGVALLNAVAAIPAPPPEDGLPHHPPEVVPHVGIEFPKHAHWHQHLAGVSDLWLSSGGHSPETASTGLILGALQHPLRLSSLFLFALTAGALALLLQFFSRYRRGSTLQYKKRF
ncbi:Golgi apyrase [Tieghemiomyces parasiticus]|uniref:Golgi apyrase n=1 Tax=Tieghemiomyces parasiticus TaxID=78921 RepID=A0A9W7ZK15_9FUNG|nr:Golgi apyrase [Tieghemiomyces parasiticus]